MKDREFDKVGLQNLHLEQATIARGQGPSENVHFKANPTQPKSDSSAYFDVKQFK
ncbi:MAG: hypothetical protein JSR93_06015 [Verrucomicrobia bacterium]|nr:hypothetical protein [Verrucomicrobiota bacterium]